MEKTIVSVIVPVYNVEKYLVRCIQSILEQTYKHLQVILVDDGSTDKSGEICDRFGKIDNRISVIHKNGGLSDARNSGIEIAKGDYLTFVDSDDYIHPKFIEILLNLCEKYQCKISKCDLQEVEEATPFVNMDTKLECKSYSAKEYMENINMLNGGFSVCNKMFKKELFAEIRFPCSKLHEDVAVIYKLGAMSGNIVEKNEKLYFYYVNTQSITRAKIKTNRLDDFEYRLELFEFCKKNDWNLAARRNADAVYRMLINYRNKDIADFEDYSEFMKALNRIKKILFKRMFSIEYPKMKEKLYMAVKLWGPKILFDKI